jgi:predicted ATPase
MNKLIVISGCSGGGKSTLISRLQTLGYNVIEEAGRVIVQEQLALKSEATPWQNPKAFCELLIEKSIAAFHQAEIINNPKENIVFFDRSFLEGVCYYQSLKLNDSNKHDHLINHLRYDQTLFMTPPWEEIFCQDDERRHTFQDALDEYNRLMDCYVKFGYDMIEIPKISVDERIEFIFSKI